MGVSLPTAEQLEKLPLRAVVAYAARTARRLSSRLRGVVADEILDDMLWLVELVSTTDLISEVDKTSVIQAAERVAAAYADAPSSLKSLEKFRIVFSLGHAAEAALFALLAATEPVYASDNRKLAAEEAYHAVRPVGALSRRAANAAMEAARHDYDILLREYGEHEGIVIGEPVQCFGAG
jgi:hypothetical protein